MIYSAIAESYPSVHPFGFIQNVHNADLTHYV